MLEFWSWLAGIGSLSAAFAMSRRWWWAPVLGLLAQVAWLFLAWHVGTGGLWFMAVAYTIMYAVATPKWWGHRKDYRGPAGPRRLTNGKTS